MLINTIKFLKRHLGHPKINYTMFLFGNLGHCTFEYT